MKPGTFSLFAVAAVSCGFVPAALVAGMPSAPALAEGPSGDAVPERPGFVHVEHGAVLPSRVHKIVSTEVTDLVLVPAGYRSGYRAGMICRVTRGGSEVGEIMMVEVRDEVSAGIIVALSPEEIMEPGDAVRVKTVQHQR